MSTIRPSYPTSRAASAALAPARLAPTMARVVVISAAEAIRELLDDAGGQDVGHLEDVEVDALVLGDVVRPVTAQPGRGLGEGLVEVLPHHLPQVVPAPRRVGGGQEVGDLPGVRV